MSAHITLEALRAHVQQATIVRDGQTLAPTRIVANQRTMRWLLHWFLSNGWDLKPAPAFGDLVMPNVDGIPFAVIETLPDEYVAVLNDNVRNEQGSFAVAFEIELPVEDTYDATADHEADAADGGRVSVWAGKSKPACGDGARGALPGEHVGDTIAGRGRTKGRVQ